MPGEAYEPNEKVPHIHDYRNCPLCEGIDRVTKELTGEVWPAIEKLRDQNTTMMTNFAVLGEQIKAIALSQTRMETALEATIKHIRESQETRYETAISSWRKALFVVIGSAITGLGAGIGWLLQWLIGR